MHKKRGLWTVLMLIGLAAFMVGCSDDSPLSSQGTSPVLQAAGEPVQFAAQVKTVNESQMMLTFEGRPDTAVASHNCLIVRLKNTMETPVPFSNVGPGDTVTINGVQQQNGVILANRIQLWQRLYDGYDMAFRDTIATIDYTTGSFTVNGYAQTIITDENTFIWGTETHNQISNQFSVQTRSNTTTAQGDPGFGTGEAHNVLVTIDFTDLAVGNIIEVKAFIVNEDTLLAAVIKVANESQKVCNVFNAYISTIDYDTRMVTFDGYGWTGYVCPKARLTGLDGEVLTLEDFAAGDYVSVKGYPTEEDPSVLKICKMEMIEP